MSNEFQSESSTKKKQNALLFIIALAIIGILALVFLNDPDIQRMMNKKHNPGNKTTSYVLPGSETNYTQQWIEKSEAELSAMRDDINSFKAEMRSMVQNMHSDVQTYIAEFGRFKADNEQLQKVDQRFALMDKKIKQEIATAIKNNQFISAGIQKEASAVDQNKSQQHYPPPQAFPSFIKKDAQYTKQEQSSHIPDLRNLAKDITPGSRKKIITVSLDYSGKQKFKNIRENIPATTVIKTVLLNGVHAPTGEIAKERPVPMFFQVLDNGSLPNKFRHKVEECRFLGSGFGDISSHRVIVRLVKFVCVLKNGNFISVDAKGTVADEQGIGDIGGKVFDRTGELIGNSVLAGTMSGFGDALSQSFTTLQTTSTGTFSSIDPNKIMDYSVANGVGSAMDKVAKFYLDRAAELYPVVEVLPGRIIDIELTEDIQLGANLWEQK